MDIFEWTSQVFALIWMHFQQQNSIEISAVKHIFPYLNLFL